MENEKKCVKTDCQMVNPQPLGEFTRNKNLCNDCTRRYHRAYKAKWAQTPKGKEANKQYKKKYRQSEAYEREKAKRRDRLKTDPEYQEKERERSRRFRQSERGKQWIAKYSNSDFGESYRKQYQKHYYMSDAYKKATKKYQQSGKWRIMAQARDARRRAAEANAPGDFTNGEWAALCVHYDFRCLACGNKFDFGDLTIDHIIPLSKGGSNDISNLQPLCKPCNSAKGTNSTDYRTKDLWVEQLTLF